MFLGNAKRKRKLLGKNLEKTLKIITKINTELTNEFLVEIYFRNYTDLLENCWFQITFNWPGTLQLTYDLGTYLNVVFFALSIADVKNGGFRLKKSARFAGTFS